MQIGKALINDGLRVSKEFCSNLPVKIAIFLKIAYFLTVSIVFSVYKQTFTVLNNLKTRAAMNAKISVFVICVEAITYLLLYNLHDCTFN